MSYLESFYFVALKLLTVPSNFPAVICCAIGKDRTGVLSALIQGCLGVPREEIVDGYHQSEVYLYKIVIYLLIMSIQFNFQSDDLYKTVISSFNFASWYPSAI